MPINAKIICMGVGRGGAGWPVPSPEISPTPKFVTKIKKKPHLFKATKISLDALMIVCQSQCRQDSTESEE